MKKLVMSLAIIAIAGLSLPQLSKASNINSFVELSEDVKFEEIQKSELPSAVDDAFTADYKDYTFKKAYKGSDGSYKIVAEKESKKYALLFDKMGKLIKKEKKDDKK